MYLQIFMDFFICNNKTIFILSWVKDFFENVWKTSFNNRFLCPHQRNKYTTISYSTSLRGTKQSRKTDPAILRLDCFVPTNNKKMQLSHIQRHCELAKQSRKKYAGLLHCVRNDGILSFSAVWFDNCPLAMTWRDWIASFLAMTVTCYFLAVWFHNSPL